jgi:hypothetical protein
MARKRRIDRASDQGEREPFTKTVKRRGLLARVAFGLLVGFAEYDERGPEIANALNELAATAGVDERWIPVASRSEARRLWPSPDA